MVEKIYLYIHVIALVVLGIATMITGETYGGATDVHFSAITIGVLFLVYLYTYFIMYMFYRKTKDNLPSIKHFPKITVDKNRLHIFYFISLLISFIGVTIFKIGIVDNIQPDIKFSFLFNLIKFNEFFPIYYIAARDEKKPIYWLNIIFYMIIRTLQGWSGWIIMIFFMELLFILKKDNFLVKTIKKLKSFILSIGAILGGTMVYYLFIPLRESIRHGGSYQWFKMSFFDAIVRLVERLSNFPVFTSAWQNIEDIIRCYQSQNIFLSEFRTIFAPLLPSFIMKNKEMRSMGNLVQQAMWPTLTNGTSTGMGFSAYWYSLFRCSFWDFIFTLAIFIIGFYISCSLLKAFNNEDNDMRILYFMLLMQIASGSTVAHMVGYGYPAALYLIFFMILFGVIKLEFDEVIKSKFKFIKRRTNK